MPIKLDNKLPALDVLRSENVFIMDENRASSQDIRPMEVLILNLMPTKEVTETQGLHLPLGQPTKERGLKNIVSYFLENMSS